MQILKPKERNDDMIIFEPQENTDIKSLGELVNAMQEQMANGFVLCPKQIIKAVYSVDKDGKVTNIYGS